MESLQRKRRKILLLFLLGVGIPSLALGYLALRGIRNEMASLEQRRLGEHRAVSRLVGDSIAREITLAESAVTHAILGGDSIPDADLGRSLDSVRHRQALVEEAFHLDEAGAIRFPAASLMYRADGSLRASPTPTWPTAAGTHFQNARQREFRERRYSEALSEYRSALAAVSDPMLKGEALLAIVRVQEKAGRSEEALASCMTLARDYGHTRTSAGVPLGVAAGLERGSLLLIRGDSLGAVRALLDLYADLVKGGWPLERAQYDFFSRETGDTIAGTLAHLAPSDSVEAYRSALEDLQGREVEFRRKTERLLLFQQTAGDELRARLGSDGQGGGPPRTRFALESAGQSYLVSILSETPAADGVWGVLLDGDALADLVGRTLQDHVDSAATDWVLRRRDGRSMVSGGEVARGPVTFNATFADNFPPWLIEFHQKPQSPYARLFASSQSIYFYMFLLIAGILVFGLVLTIRTVTHELELARLKSDFVSTVSHEFKSPLTSIRHLAEMLQADSVPSEERRRRYYDVLVEQSTRLSSLVTNILDLARLEEGRKEFLFEVLDMGGLVRDLVTATQQRVSHEGYVVDVAVEDGLPQVRADRGAITQALTNVVDNAIQYSRAAKDVALRVSGSEGWVMVEVEDHGAGISPNDIDKVFERFYRGGDALTRSVKGSGLGLALVREVVEAHGGTVHVESTVGKGSTFTIRLPTAVEPDDVEDSDHRG